MPAREDGHVELFNPTNCVGCGLYTTGKVDGCCCPRCEYPALVKWNLDGVLMHCRFMAADRIERGRRKIMLSQTGNMGRWLSRCTQLVH